MKGLKQNSADIQKLLDNGYSYVAIAMTYGGPVGTKEYHALLKQLDPNYGKGCPACGQLCFGTGDCNCMDT